MRHLPEPMAALLPVGARLSRTVYRMGCGCRRTHGRAAADGGRRAPGRFANRPYTLHALPNQFGNLHKRGPSDGSRLEADRVRTGNAER
jgi:hypothetical protein